MRAVFVPLLAICLVVTGCEEEVPPGAPITEGGLPDVLVVFPPPRDGGDASDGETEDAGDGSTPFACTGAPFEVRASAPGTTLAIAAGGSDDDFLVVWTVTAAGTTDVFARRVPPTGSLGPVWQITTNEDVESSPAVLTTGNTWLTAFTTDSGAASDIVTYGLDPADPIGATQTNITLDAATDAAPRLFDAGAGTVVLWHRPSLVPKSASSMRLDALGDPVSALVPVDAMTTFNEAPSVFDRGTAGPAAFFLSGQNNIQMLPLTSSGVVDAAGSPATIVAPGATNRLAFSRAGTSSRLFIGATSSISSAALGTNGAPAGATSTVNTSGTNERSPAAVGLANAHLLAYRTSMSGTPTLRLAALAPTNASVISDVAITTLDSLDGDVVLTTTSEGDILLVYTDVSGANVQVAAARIACTGE